MPGINKRKKYISEARKCLDNYKCKLTRSNIFSILQNVNIKIETTNSLTEKGKNICVNKNYFITDITLCNRE